MAETTVTFLTYDSTTAVYTPEIRVFELEISADAQAYYLACMQQLATFMDMSNAEGVEEMSNILKSLDTWSKYKYILQGEQVSLSSTAIPNILSSEGETIMLSSLGTMDRYMAESVDKLIRTFRAAGYDPITDTFTKTGITLSDVAAKLFVTDASLYDVAGTLTQGINAARQCRIETNVWTQSESIQQLLMVDYISRGNELLFNEMSELKTAIDINQSTLAYLNSLQDLMNQKDPEHFIMALQNLSGTVGGDIEKYAAFEEQTFNKELSNVAKFTDDEISDYLRNILGLDPSAVPTASQISGTALGSFQTLDPEYFEKTLNAFLENSSVSATLETLLPSLTDYPEFAESLNILVDTYGLVDSDKQLIWQVFLVSEAGMALPSTVDLASPTTLANFNTFLTSLGTLTSTTVVDILQDYVETVGRNIIFIQTLLADANVSTLEELEAIDLSGLTVFEINTATFYINGYFTAFPLTAEERLNVLRAYIVKYPIGLTPPLFPNLLITYVKNLSASCEINPVTWLTAIPDIDINEYATILSTKCPTADGYTNADRLNIWKGFLVAMDLTDAESFPLGTSTTTAAFSTYLDTLTPMIESPTENEVINAVYAYLLQYKLNLPIFSPENSVALSEVDYPDPPKQSQVVSIINLYFPNTIYSDEDQLNIWRAYMINQGETDPDSWSFLTSAPLLTDFVSRLAAFVSPDQPTGADLLTILESYAFYPEGTITQLENFIDDLESSFPSPSTDEDRLNILKGYITADNHSGSDYSFGILFSQAWNPYKDAVNYRLVGTSGTGQDVINAINATRYLPQGGTSLDSFTADLPSQITFSEFMDETLGTIGLTDEQKFQIWYVYLTTQAGTQSLMTVGGTTEQDLNNFKDFLNTLKTDNVGAAIDTRIVRIINNLQYLIDKITQVSSASSLKDQLQIILNDFQGLVDNGDPLSTWVEDYASGRVGDYQKHLNDTIVASQALNDTEREELRRVMFVYEEFYKSATAMLSRLTQLIEKMASAIK